MTEKQKLKKVRLAVLVTYLIMVSVNALATALPINGQTTGQVSDALPNLFAPAGLTFSIWGLIYLLLAGYTLFQFGFLQPGGGVTRSKLYISTGIFFALSSLVNSAWIFAWHYNQFALSLILMLLLLVLLIRINLELAGKKLTLLESFLIRVPFSVYFGWITVATIANVTSYLVSTGFSGFGISEPIWTALVIVVGAAIGIATILRLRSVPYGLVILWAYLGIWIKHTGESGFDGQYPLVIATVIAALLAVAAAMGAMLFKSRAGKA